MKNELKFLQEVRLLKLVKKHKSIGSTDLYDHMVDNYDLTKPEQKQLKTYRSDLWNLYKTYGLLNSSTAEMDLDANGALEFTQNGGHALYSLTAAGRKYLRTVEELVEELL